VLKKENRLKSKKAFTATYSNHKIISDNLIILYVGRLKSDIENLNDDIQNRPTRVGFVVSKKVHKRAVKRNRIKRLMRENLRLILKNEDNKNDNLVNILNKYQSFIFMARTNTVDKNFNEIKISILTLLNKLANKNL